MASPVREDEPGYEGPAGAGGAVADGRARVAGRPAERQGAYARVCDGLRAYRMIAALWIRSTM
ncbi:MAG: hypothetical protein QOC85_1009, partial [Streptomyces sp.]|nr:hypothetical protein [Streptomyces sp.]